MGRAAFDDLYTAVYAVLDNAKEYRALLKLYKGSHGSADPHPVVLEFGKFFATHHRGVLGYACHTVHPDTTRYRVDDLDEFDRRTQPRVHTRQAFQLLESFRRTDETSDDYLTCLARRQHRLGAYRGGSSGWEDEAQACAAALFRQLGHPVRPTDVLTFCGGFKGALICACAAAMSHRCGDQLLHRGGAVLAPRGYYQSLRLIPPIFAGDIDVVAELDGATVSAWLSDTRSRTGRILYVPLVNNADGRVLCRDRACRISEAVLTHNSRHPTNPVWVVADDVYAGSYLSPHLVPQPIGALSGADLNDSALGAMSDCTLSVLTSSKTVALPTTRVAFTATTNATMRARLAHYRTVFSFGRVPQCAELSAVAALCLTPQAWIDTWNREYRHRLGVLCAGVHAINNQFGHTLFQVPPPEGGWYFPLRIAQHLFPARVTSAAHAAAVLAYCSGVAMLPGELFGHGLDGPQPSSTPWIALTLWQTLTSSSPDGGSDRHAPGALSSHCEGAPLGSAPRGNRQPPGEGHR